MFNLQMRSNTDFTWSTMNSFEDGDVAFAQCLLMAKGDYYQHSFRVRRNDRGRILLVINHH